ncbi:MAG: hypothetical protein HYW26_01265 [Candidatus Aenigmarchaeota archaeon]|nr:hypothetical protein [Candidatus Aenigmarchaeota archaeon]
MVTLTKFLRNRKVDRSDVRTVRFLLQQLSDAGIQFGDARKEEYFDVAADSVPTEDGFSAKYIADLKDSRDLTKPKGKIIDRSLVSSQVRISRDGQPFLTLEHYEKGQFFSLFFNRPDLALADPDVYKFHLHDGAPDVVINSILAEKRYFERGTDDPVHDDPDSTFILSPEIGKEKALQLFPFGILLKSSTESELTYYRLVWTRKGYALEEVVVRKKPYESVAREEPYSTKTLGELSGRYKGVTVARMKDEATEAAMATLWSAGLRAAQSRARAAVAYGELGRVLRNYNSVAQQITMPAGP